MLRLLFAFIVFLHGLIHLMGFSKAFGYGNISQLTKDISKTMGILWLTAALLFLAAGIIFLMKKDHWWMPGLLAVVLSQTLIFSVWQDARFGTVANLIVLVVGMFAFGNWRFENNYKHDVAASIAKAAPADKSLITEADLQHLPHPVQRYLRYAGVLNKPKIWNYKVCFAGQMREKGKDWFSFTSEQYNFTGEPTRLFFMKAKMYGFTVPGYHDYKNGDAGMHIKLLGLIPVVNINSSSGVLDKAETVTLFNDMCMFAPGALINKNIQWEAIDDTTAIARYSVNGHTISAQLYFKENGELANFVSDDRYALADKKQYRFSTPVGAYKTFDGHKLPSYGEAIWHYPEGEFVYGKFNTQTVVYNTGK